jgi:hypothetical protein
LHASVFSEQSLVEPARAQCKQTPRKLSLIGFRFRLHRTFLDSNVRNFCCCRRAMDDYVGADNPARFADAFVDLSASGFPRATANATVVLPMPRPLSIDALTA